MKSETLTISRYKPQFCSGEVSGPLFLNLARFQNYCRTTSRSLDSSFDFTLFLRVPLFVCSVEGSLKLMYFNPSHWKPSVFNWQLLASPGVSVPLQTGVSSAGPHLQRVPLCRGTELVIVFQDVYCMTQGSFVGTLLFFFLGSLTLK